MSEKPGIPDNNPDSDSPIIDPEVKEEVEKNGPEGNLFAEYASGNQSESEQTDVTRNWIGDEKGDNWKPKTLLSPEQIIAFSQVRMLSQTFRELEEIEEILGGTVENLEQYAVSRDGIAREQHKEVLKAMHSGENPSDETGEMLSKLFANPDSDNE